MSADLPLPLSDTTTALCEDCPPVGYPTDETRCLPCPRRAPIDAGEWRPWSSKGKRYGELPVECGTLVDVRYRDGGERFCVPAGIDTGPQYRDAETRFWVQERHHSDIMFWRLAVPAKATGAA